MTSTPLPFGDAPNDPASTYVGAAAAQLRRGLPPGTALRTEALAQAQIYATLALAEEQRTANLLAWLAWASRPSGDMTRAPLAQRVAVDLLVADRLGVRDL